MSDFNDSDFWSKLRHQAQNIGQSVLVPALTLYHAAQDSNTPLWAKTTIYGALGYLILPLDAIPDLIPVAGYSDDLSVLLAALGTVTLYIKDEHREQAQMQVYRWLG